MRGFSEEERREGDAETLAAGEIGHPAMNGIRPEEEASEIRAEVPPHAHRSTETTENHSGNPIGASS